MEISPKILERTLEAADKDVIARAPDPAVILALVYLRTFAHMSQRKLAQLMGVSKTSVSNYEKGLTEPGGEAIRQLCDQFGMTRAQFWRLAESIHATVGQQRRLNQAEAEDVARAWTEDLDRVAAPARRAILERFAERQREEGGLARVTGAGAPTT